MSSTNEAQGVFLSKDTSSAAEYAAAWEALATGLRGIVAAYDLTGLAPIKSSGELSNLVNNTAHFILQRQTGGSLNVSGAEGQAVAVSVEHMANVVEKPMGYDKLAFEIEALRKSVALGRAMPWNTAAIARDFKVEGGQVCYSDRVQTLIDTAGELRAKTEKGMAIARFMNKLTEAFFAEGMERYFKPDTYLGKRIVRIESISPTLEGWGLLWLSVEGKTMQFKRSDARHPEFMGDR